MTKPFRLVIVALPAITVLALAVPSALVAEGEELAAEAAWSVDETSGPSREVPLDVTEGTWMSIDVSPDGEWIVFDLLGDIYEIPITGGEARALSQGVSWDMQPRYSPGGERIAFTSDRGGGNNIWTMRRDGTGARPASSEHWRLLNSPAWTPDGDFVAGRKHFTSARSLGAGEIWLYHRSGSGGLRMTVRPNDQKDLGEPAFSPDGRYLYFSQDVTPGDRFQYNKNSNTEIYAIQRLDRQSGEIVRLVTGPGGSVRPTPSPDGRSLAFVRRVRGRSALFLFDLESGAERLLYGELDRDMQEAWAIHGVYPAMAWTPDSRSIVFWAGGKIRRLEVSSGQQREIPFRVRSTRRVSEALHFRQEPSADRFRPNMLRWVEVSPLGDRVVYQALGHLWIRDLPEGAPRRLTAQDEHFEFFPTFSSDGRWIVYTTWSDSALGAVRRVSAGGGEGRILTAEPGHYVEPSLNPAGDKVVYRKVASRYASRGAWLRNPLWSQATGIYWLPVEGGEANRIVAAGARPRFDPSADPRSPKVFFTSSEPGDKRVLKSIELDGSDERIHARSAAARRLRLSPDGRWLAFRERFNAYIVPFAATGETLEISPGMSSVPLRKVSRDAGDYLHWSGDSRRLHWLLGSRLFTRDLRDVFAFVPGAREVSPAPAAGRDIGFEAATDAPAGTVAIVGARVITMRGDEVLERGTVVVSGRRISAVGPTEETPVPEGAYVLDASGKTVLPGLIDVHDHMIHARDDLNPQHNWQYYAQLAFGVTTTHDPGTSTGPVLTASELARAGLITAPRIYSTGSGLSSEERDHKAEIDDFEDALSHVRRKKALGAFTVKSYNQPRREQRQQIIAAGRELGLMVLPEGGSLFHNNMTMIVDGHTGIEHCLPVADIYEDVLQLWAGSGTAYTPTLGVAFGGLKGQNYWYQHTDVWAHQKLSTFVPRRVLDARSRRRTMAPEEEYNHFNAARVARRLADRGVQVQVGAHGEREGLAVHWEIWMLVQGGMSPHQALRAATWNGAAYLGLDGELGSLEPGKLADLIVLDRDPLVDIRNSDSVAFTMLNGRLYDAGTMDQIGHHPAARGKLWWEMEREP